jgi:diguanylate cyclase (GGDEF)-like protein
VTALRALAEREARHLEQLQSSDHGLLMIRLVHTECLLQLAKLSSTELDMASYADLVVDTLEQFLPVDGCRLAIEVIDVPPIAALRGVCDGANSTTSSAALVIGENGSGQITVSVTSPELGPPEFVGAVAEQISNGLAVVAQAERLRRQAAVAEAGRLITSLSDAPTESDLQGVAGALSYLPNIIGVELQIAHPVIEGVARVSAGLRATDPFPTVDMDGGYLDLAVAWAAPPSDNDRQTIADSIASLAAVLYRAQERRRIAVEAQTDPLTGIANRRKAMQVLDDVIEAASFRNETVAVAALDLDSFKQVNDRFGHPAGDQVLMAFAGHLQASARQPDTVARLGGEEFLIIYPGLDATTAAGLLRLLITGTPEACRVDGATDWTQTVSVGLAVYPHGCTTPEEILSTADAALYRAKRAGRNRLEISTP